MFVIIAVSRGQSSPRIELSVAVVIVEFVVSEVIKIIGVVVVVALGEVVVVVDDDTDRFKTRRRCRSMIDKKTTMRSMSKRNRVPESVLAQSNRRSLYRPV